MILLIDADSLIFASCYRHREKPTDAKYFDTLEECVAKFDEQFMKIVNDLEEKYDVEKVITFNGSKGNFRKLITKKYKANRKKQHEYTPHRPVRRCGDSGMCFRHRPGTRPQHHRIPPQPSILWSDSVEHGHGRCCGRFVF